MLPAMTLDDVRTLAGRLRDRMRYDVIGRDDIIELVLIALFADGHVLLEDYPGSGKTTLAKALGHGFVEETQREIPTFRRVQFTPDLLPSDVTGVTMFEPTTNTFTFRRGPVFASVLLVDEINRTSPKVQSALLEAMAEKQVTVDNVSHRLDDLFFVIATQNPLDSVGTYPLPLAQLDRFLFKLSMKHIDAASELQVLKTWGQPRTQAELPQINRAEVIAARQVMRTTVAVAPSIQQCLSPSRRRSSSASSTSPRACVTRAAPARASRPAASCRPFPRCRCAPCSRAATTSRRKTSRRSRCRSSRTASS